MSWEVVLQNDAGAGEPLLRRIEALFAQQRAAWPALRDGEAALAHLRTKALVSDGARVVVQTNPARRRSTLAKTDSQSVAARPCFLCPENMPPEERGVAFEDLVILPNPYPILPRHSTVAGREHRPQQLAGRVATLLRLAAAIGPELAAFYNGPRCGASAPDHFHFQAASAAEIPILAQLPHSLNGRQGQAYESFRRVMMVFASPDAADVCANIERTLELMRVVCSLPEPVREPRARSGAPGTPVRTTDDREPMINLVVHFNGQEFRAVLFPRQAHRPRCYFADGQERLSVSPAALEMAGVLVVTEPEEFARLDAAAARAVYEEVSLERAQFYQLAASLT